jgi:RNA-directed DNA polymerase
MAVKLVIEPIFEADFCPHSYGFRPNRSAHDAVDDIATTLRAGYTQVIDADLSKYFDRIPHAKLMAVMAERLVDGGILHLIQQWLKAPVVGEDANGARKIVGGGKANRRGTPQGGVISPLLANCYLHLLDRIWQRHHLRHRLKAHVVRYADDFVVLCKGEVEEPLMVVKRIVEHLELELNETKTHRVDATEASFDFLGFTIRMSQGRKTGNWFANVRPADRSLKKIKARLTQLTGKNQTLIPLSDVVENVNRSLRGWANYFHYRNSTKAMSRVRQHAEDRLRIHLRARYKVRRRCTGFVRFPRRHLYERYGLYRPPTVAGWRSAHASV